MKHSFSLLLAVVVCVLLGIHLQLTQEYMFFFREQLMVFYNDLPTLLARYLSVSGPGLLLTHFLTQFFILDYAGAVVSAVLGALATWLLYQSLPRENRSILMFPLCVVPVIFQCDALFDIYYAYQGLVCYFLFTLFAFLYQVLASRIENYNLKILTGAVLSLLLFYLAGAVGFLLSVYILILEITIHPRQSWKMSSPVVLILLAALFCVSRAVLPLYRYALLNSAYYEPIIEPSNFFHTSWIVVLLIPLLAPLFTAMGQKLKPVFSGVGSVVLLALVAAFAVNSADRNQQKMYPMIAMDHYILKGDTRGLLKTPYCQSGNYILMNRVNYALSKEHVLLDDFFHYPQLAPYSIMNDLGDLALDVEIITTLSELYYEMDNIASADEKAFNTYEGLRYGCPTALKMLVKTSLIFGRYPQAEKYIKMLENTTFYKEWATSQRKFLYDDEAVNRDPEYGEKRKSLPIGTREFVQARGPFADLMLTLRANPHETQVRDYAIAYLLLANDVPHINAFAEEFYGTEAMPKTPLRLQEALVAANEKDLEYCRAHGVEESTIASYQHLKDTMNQMRSGQSAQSSLQEWRYTYWYYLLVTSPNLAKMREQMQRENAAKQSEQVSAHG